jgi:hypothetical protein
MKSPRGHAEWLSPGAAAFLVVVVIFLGCALVGEEDFFGQLQAAIARLVSAQQQIAPGGRP